MTQSTTDVCNPNEPRRARERPGTSAPWPTLAVLAPATTSVAIQQTLVLPLLAQLQVALAITEIGARRRRAAAIS